MNNKSNTKDGRTRSWNFIVYPDSAPNNWEDILNELCVPWVKSPLHDKDINADGTPKKPHWHCTMIFEGVKSFTQICSILEPLNCPIPQVCHSARASVRYMAHLDNPEKAQYNVSDIRGFGGVDVTELLKYNTSERYYYIDQMIDYIKENTVTEFMDLMDYARAEHRDDWFPLLCDNSAYIVQQYIKSLRHSRKEEKLRSESQWALESDKAIKETLECNPDFFND